MRISVWSSDVCSSDLVAGVDCRGAVRAGALRAIAMARRRTVALFPTRWRIALLLVVFAGCAVVSVAPGPGSQGDAYLAAHVRDGVSVRHQRLQTNAARLAYVSVGAPGPPVGTGRAAG